MSGLIPLPPEAWLPAAAGGFAADFDLPGPGGLAIEAAGWAHPAAARLLPPEGAPLHFVAVPGGGFLAALGAAAEMLVAARQHPATQAGAAAVLDHLARHPLCRSPALGAFVAALTE